MICKIISALIFKKAEEEGLSYPQAWSYEEEICTLFMCIILSQMKNKWKSFFSNFVYEFVFLKFPKASSLPWVKLFRLYDKST